ncbi:hypothetical protein F5Y16DRAFT_337522 [Xylariaceae sp. FL0255]|nr:hypothetical protein F5Y16DRAFT_337522 [Xylariaceae sp. FL0255]
MQRLWLVRLYVSIIVSIRGAWAIKTQTSGTDDVPVAPKVSRISQTFKYDEATHEDGSHILPDYEATESIYQLKERCAILLPTPQPTARSSLRKRQDDAQVAALSSQIQSLSQSATQVLSSVSSSASSFISQAQSQASLQISQTVSSASSAVSSVISSANFQISQSLSSMSSRISSNLASAQSSASSAISSAELVASQFAASQIQAARESISDDTNNTPTSAATRQGHSVSISEASLAIIITVSVIGSASLATVVSYLVLRYRRKRMQSPEEKPVNDRQRSRENLIAVRGSRDFPSPRFPRFGAGALSPMSFKLPKLSPSVQAKKNLRGEEKKIGLAVSDYSHERSAQNRSSENTEDDQKSIVANSTSQLQKNSGLSKATSVRIIRIGSGDSKGVSNPEAQYQTKNEIPRRPVATEKQENLKEGDQGLARSGSQSSRLSRKLVKEPPKATEPLPPTRLGEKSLERGYRDSEMADRRVTMQSTMTTQNPLQFRDSSDIESSTASPLNDRATMMTPLRNTNTASLRMSRPENPPNLPYSSSYGVESWVSSQPRPKYAGARFVTFPRAPSQGPPRESMLNRPRPTKDSNAVRLRREEENRQRELAEMRSMGGRGRGLL